MKTMEKAKKPARKPDFSELPENYEPDGSYFFLCFFMEEESSPEDPVLDMHRKVTDQESYDALMYNVELMWGLGYEIRRRKAWTFFGKDRHEIWICIRWVPDEKFVPKSPLEKNGRYTMAKSICKMIGEEFDPERHLYAAVLHGFGKS